MSLSGAALRERARAVLWGIAIMGAVQVAAAYLAQNHTGAVIAQLVIAEFGTGRLGVAWSDPLAPIPTGAAIARRVARGALLGVAAAAVLVGASVMFHVAFLQAGTFGLAPLIVGFLVSICTAARDELLLRGLVLRALGPGVHAAVKLGVCGLAGAAFRFGSDPSLTLNLAGVMALVFAFFAAMAFGSLWLRDRGAWLAVSANALFMFFTGPLIHGALLDIRGDIGASFIGLACGVAIATSAYVYGIRDSGRMPT